MRRPVSRPIVALFALLILVQPQLVAAARDAPVPIYYGLNGSHSNDWARRAPDGSIGVTFFQPDEGVNPDHLGALLYRVIASDGSFVEEEVAVGSRLDKSVLLYDADGTPNIYLAESDDLNQTVTRHRRSAPGDWAAQPILDFQGEGGKYIYEMSAAAGPDGAHHLLLLKSRSNPDSDDYYFAFMDAHLYHATNASGAWARELIDVHHTFYTMDEHAKINNRQDLAVDGEGHVHVVFGMQIDALTNYSPCRLEYATNGSGAWVRETAVDYDPGSRDSAGWWASLALDGEGRPHVACAYIDRVSTGSTISSDLRLYRRDGAADWSFETVATTDDGYCGGDGPGRTGALTHLVFDAAGDPDILFTDIASSHEPRNVLNLGNVRFASRRQGVWSLRTVYRQPPPDGYTRAEEMFGLCLLLSPGNDRVDLIGQDLIVDGVAYGSHLIHEIVDDPTGAPETPAPPLRLGQNYPNPFNPATTIAYTLSAAGAVRLTVHDAAGARVRTLLDGTRPAGSDSVIWDGRGDDGERLASGAYFCRLTVDERVESRKMVLLN